VRSIRLSCSALTALLLFATPAPAQVTGSYTAPAEFMNLFFDFTGSEEPDYPAGQPTLGQMVTQSAKESAGGAPGRGGIPRTRPIARKERWALASAPSAASAIVDPVPNQSNSLEVLAYLGCGYSR